MNTLTLLALLAAAILGCAIVCVIANEASYRVQRYLQRRTLDNSELWKLRERRNGRA